MKMLKKSCLIFVIIAYIVSVCGCGTTSTSDNNTSNTTVVEQTDEGIGKEDESETLEGNTSSDKDTELETEKDSTETTETEGTDEGTDTNQEVSSSEEQPANGTTQNQNQNSSQKEEKPAYVPQTEDEKLAAIFWESFGQYRNYLGEEKSQAACAASVELVKKIMKQYSTELDREKAVHDYICQTCVYDDVSVQTGLRWEGQTPYGVLIEKKAVCGGYANTFMICMNMMGIECNLITGGDHGWNQVRIDGEWYEVDCTWNDRDNTYTYDFFNLTSAEMDAADHAKYHASRPRTCSGGKYGQAYFKEQARKEFFAKNANTYFESIDKVKEYLNGQAAKNIADNLFYVSKDVFDVMYSWDKGFSWADTDYRYGYYDYNLYYSSTRYDSYAIEGVYSVDVSFVSMSELEQYEGYMSTLEELKSYLELAKSQGKTSVEIYMSEDLYEEQPNWRCFFTRNVGNMCVVYQYLLTYEEGYFGWE